jgi:hypothetical protein
MRIIKTALHYWFGFISVLSFLVGWGMLAHSLKPIQPVQTATQNSISLPALLPPIQSYNGGTQNGNGLIFPAPINPPNSNNQSIFGTPRLRSGGS